MSHLNGHQREVCAAVEGFLQALHPYLLNSVRVILLKECQHALVPLGLDAFKLLEGHEEGQREGAVLVRQGNHHELVPRPYVEVVDLHVVLFIGRIKSLVAKQQLTS